VFVFFLGGLLAVVVVAFVYGNPLVLANAVDSEGRICGVGRMKNRPYLFTFDLVVCSRMGVGIFVQGCPTPQVCVSECPDNGWHFKQRDREDAAICRDGVKPTSEDLKTLVEKQLCVPYYFASYSFLHHCVPKRRPSSIVAEVIAGTMLTDSSEHNVTGDDVNHAKEMYKAFLLAEIYQSNIANDLYKCRNSLTLFAWLSMLLCCVWVAIMSLYMFVMMWTAIGLCFVILIIVVVICYHQFAVLLPTDERFKNSNVEKAPIYLMMGILFNLVLLVCLCTVLSVGGGIRRTTRLIKECSRAVSMLPSTLLWPVGVILVQLCVLGIWLFITFYIASMPRAIRAGNRVNQMTFTTENIAAKKKEVADLFTYKTCDKSNSDHHQSEICGSINDGYVGGWVVFMHVYNSFMCLWLLLFVKALQQMTHSGVFAKYYWAYDKETVPQLYPLLSFGRTLRYHLGSVAMGSLPIGFFSCPRTCMLLCGRKMDDKKSCLRACLLCCLDPCLYFKDRVLLYASRKTYVLVAVQGLSFCVSGVQTFKLVTYNAYRVLLVDLVVEGLLLVPRLMMAMGMGLIAFYFYNNDFGRLTYLTPYLEYPFLPIFFLMLTVFLMSKVFFDVFQTAVDTAYMCFLQDVEIHDGSLLKPYFMTKGLIKVLALRKKGEDYLDAAERLTDVNTGKKQDWNPYLLDTSL
jgi:choline transporter-like protein 2/4/5